MLGHANGLPGRIFIIPNAQLSRHQQILVIANVAVIHTSMSSLFGKLGEVVCMGVFPCPGHCM